MLVLVCFNYNLPGDMKVVSVSHHRLSVWSFYVFTVSILVFHHLSLFQVLCLSFSMPVSVSASLCLSLSFTVVTSPQLISCFSRLQCLVFSMFLLQGLSQSLYSFSFRICSLLVPASPAEPLSLCLSHPMFSAGHSWMYLSVSPQTTPQLYTSNPSQRNLSTFCPSNTVEQFY